MKQWMYLGLLKISIFWASCENFKNHQVEQKIHFFGKKIYCPVFVMGKIYISQKNAWEIT